MVRKFRRLGFEGPFSGGWHLFMRKDRFKVYIPNPHRGDLSAQLVSKLVRRAEVSPEEWDEA